MQKRQKRKKMQKTEKTQKTNKIHEPQRMQKRQKRNKMQKLEKKKLLSHCPPRCLPRKRQSLPRRQRCIIDPIWTNRIRNRRRRYGRRII